MSLASLHVFALTTNEMAPVFKLQGVGTNNRDVSLSNLKGKIIVLEWLNHGCPFVKKHYESGNMQSLQKKYTKKNVVWLSIISSAEGKQGHVNTAGAIKNKNAHKSFATDILLDPKGRVGKLYMAKTTPHMFIIDKEGKLVYQGAIDDTADTNTESIKGSKNYVAQALDEMLAGKAVSTATTKSYGCSVKY